MPESTICLVEPSDSIWKDVVIERLQVSRPILPCIKDFLFFELIEGPSLFNLPPAGVSLSESPQVIRIGNDTVPSADTFVSSATPKVTRCGPANSGVNDRRR
jgi:hypothetical protein